MSRITQSADDNGKVRIDYTSVCSLPLFPSARQQSFPVPDARLSSERASLFPIFHLHQPRSQGSAPAGRFRGASKCIPFSALVRAAPPSSCHGDLIKLSASARDILMDPAIPERIRELDFTGKQLAYIFQVSSPIPPPSFSSINLKLGRKTCLLALSVFPQAFLPVICPRSSLLPASLH